ncbi:MAG: hypothetical protein Q4C34_04940 [Bacteroidales bacterium]|nr:hypothetical protein [Bacteroidales bacterium]
MKHFIISFLWLLGAILTVSGADRYALTAERATRAYDSREWSSAAALYELMLDMRPDSSDIYARAIVANIQVPDTAATVDLMERAMSHGLGLADVLTEVRTQSFAIGRGDSYGDYLLQLRAAMPWMSRALDHELLEYYTFRNDGPMTVRYARIMLAGLPESAEYRAVLARGYLLSGDDRQAVATWQAMLQTDHDDYTALLNLGNYHAVMGDNTEAAEYLRRAQRLHPTPYVEATLRRLDMRR